MFLMFEFSIVENGAQKIAFHTTKKNIMQRSASEVNSNFSRMLCNYLQV